MEVHSRAGGRRVSGDGGGLPDSLCLCWALKITLSGQEFNSGFVGEIHATSENPNYKAINMLMERRYHLLLILEPITYFDIPVISH